MCKAGDAGAEHQFFRTGDPDDRAGRKGGVVFMARSDEDIRRDVLDHLSWDNSVNAREIFVDVRDGNVRLSGRVPDPVARRSAEIDAWVVQDVVSVDNQIGIRVPGEQDIPGDDDIRQRIESILAWNPTVDAAKISVSVHNGVVTLEGTVDSYWKRGRAEDMVFNVRGVVGVNNTLTVVPTGNVVDERIAGEIVAAFKRNANLDAERIEVRVENGRVSLTGTVPNWDSCRMAEDTARFTAGVTEIVNNLSLEYSPERIVVRS